MLREVTGAEGADDDLLVPLFAGSADQNRVLPVGEQYGVHHVPTGALVAAEIELLVGGESCPRCAAQHRMLDGIQANETSIEDRLSEPRVQRPELLALAEVHLRAVIGGALVTAEEKRPDVQMCGDEYVEGVGKVAIGCDRPFGGNPIRNADARTMSVTCCSSPSV